MSVTSIKLESGISDPEFMGISTTARKCERSHLLGLLRIRMGLLKEQCLTSEEIYSALEQWIANHETITSEGSKQ
ncbi:hypothetical protein ACR76C_17025 [Klebsiella grimontii]|uniref:hypothetical protein n=1 Tax=Klebsiella grimontii TaxID=2058152 RepID=UPI0012BA359B|nr:hypothetical protein [Klebsiella grimontii]MDG9899080.1 hypothetical protein [Klebsiella grimontii]